MIVVEVSIECDLWAALPNAEVLAAQAVEKARKITKIKLHKAAEISVLLVDDSRIASLNARWRNIAKATNVLSFPASAPEKLAANALLGDIVLAFETVRREALDEGKSLANHFSHLVVHGFLHLIGYDHINEADAEIMEALEIKILAGLKIADPYSETELVLQR